MTNSTTLIVDCETDGFLDQMTRLWTIQIGTPDDDVVHVYADQPGYEPLAAGVERLRAAQRLVFHNGVGFDIDAINKLFPDALRFDQLFDTMIAARLIDPTRRSNRLKDWGVELKVAKGDYAGDFQTFTQDLVDYAIQDIVVTRALYRYLLPRLAGQERVLDVEHKFARMMVLQERTGFTLDLPAVHALEATLRGEMSDIETALQAIFPPIEIKVPFVPKVNLPARGYVKGVPTYKVHQETFNPGSRQQIAARLQVKGWKPDKFTPTGIPQVDETTLAPLPWPEAKQLVRYLTIEKSLGQIADGKNGWLKLVTPAGKVHGRVNTIGCAPGRCSHMTPNMAQVNKKDHRMRAVWTARPGWKLVGVDGEGLQARALAHYLTPYDGGAFGRKVHEGRKSDRTDVHSANLVELSRGGCILCPEAADQETWDKGRDGAKRCLYASWFGAGNPKLGWTAKDGAANAGLPIPKVKDGPLGQRVRIALNRAIVGFEKLCEKIQATAKARGFLVSPLGRHVPIRSPHSALVFLMQAVEADVMKQAAVIFHYEVVPLHGWRYDVDFAYVANVHDEDQIEAVPELAATIGAAFAQCITEAGTRLGLRCPLAGDFKVGANWAETH